MKKISPILIFTLIYLNIFFSFNSYSLLDTEISSFTSSSYSNLHGTSAYLNLTIKTKNTNSNSKVRIELTDNSGKSLDENIVSDFYIVNDNAVNIPFTIPSNLEAGIYKLKAVLSTPSLIETESDTQNISYTIYPSGNSDSSETNYMGINSINTNSATLIEGYVTGNIYISGSNFKNNLTTLELKNNSNNTLNDVTDKINDIQTSKIELELPSDLKEGLYTIIAKSKNNETESISSFKVSEKTPVINSINVSADNSLIANAIDGTVTIKGANFIFPEQSTICQLTDSNDSIISVINPTNINNTKIVFEIPKNLTAGKYFIKITSNSKSVTSDDYFSITSPNSLEPFILSIKTDYSNIYENNISGNLNITGTNLYPISNINLINTNSLEIHNLKPLVSESEKIQIKIPEYLEAGEYKIEITISGKTINSSAFTVLKESVHDNPVSLPNTISNIFNLNVNNSGIIENKNETSTDYSLDLENISELIEEKKETMTNILSVNTKDDNLNKLHLESKILNELKNNNIGINLKNDFGEIIIPPAFFRENELNPLTVKVEKIQNSNINEKLESGLKILGNPIDFEIVDSKNKIYNTFTENLKINIPVNTDKTDEFSLKKLAVYYFNEENSAWEFIGGRYNEDTKQISIYVNHLTQFAVIEKEKTFDDIKNHWGKEYIEVLSSRNIINGIKENEFKPNDNLTRAQFTTLIVKGLNIPLLDHQNTFNDVTQDSWYCKYIETAVENNIISGYGNGLFKPNANITREEMASIIVKSYLYYNNITLNDLELINSTEFEDYNNISDWAKTSVTAAYSMNFIKGLNSNQFSPKTYSNRAQAAVIIYRLLNSIELI